MFKDEKIDNNLKNVKNKIIILSGKGGVGKTTVSSLIAMSLAKKGYKTGLLDIDIHGPDSAKMFGLSGKLEVSKFGIEPKVPFENLKILSLSFMLEKEEQPVIWRGPLKIMTIKQFLSEVNWGELDYLIIDSPPGTGDEPLTVCQFINDLKAIVVTMPQNIAIYDTRKCIEFLKSLKVEILGVVENMSGFVCPHCGKRVEIFGSGGGEKLSSQANVPFLGKIPIDTQIISNSDKGFSFDQVNSAYMESFFKIIERFTS